MSGTAGVPAVHGREEVKIYDPDLDEDGVHAATLADILVEALTQLAAST